MHIKMKQYTNQEFILLGKLIISIELLRDGHVSRNAVAMELDIDPVLITPFMNKLGSFKANVLAEQLFDKIMK